MVSEPSQLQFKVCFSTVPKLGLGLAADYRVHDSGQTASRQLTPFFNLSRLRKLQNAGVYLSVTVGAKQITFF